MKKEAFSGKIAVSAGPGTLLERLRLQGYHLRADCGGEGSCGRCRVRFLSIVPQADAKDEAWCTPDEITAGWRLACRHEGGAVEMEYNPDWELRFSLEPSGAIQPDTQVGLAVDIGTTGLVAGLVDLATGKPLLTARGYNPQRAWGADVMTRLVAGRDPAALNLMQQSILNAIQDAVKILREEIPPLLRGVRGDLLVVGNTAMIHLAAGIPETTLSVFPFHSPLEDRVVIPITWDGNALKLAGPLQGFVGSDLLAVLRALNLHSNDSPLIKGGRGDLPTLVIDLGTNSEIALWDGRLYHVTSCAAGPAFEGGGLSCGSAAGPGVAVDVRLEENNWRLRPNDGQPKSGLCGSALIALLAELLRGARMDVSGKLLEAKSVRLQDHPALSLTQKDVRSLQLAKGAIHTGITVLARRATLPLGEIGRVIVTGAFARSLKRDDLKAIGLVPSQAAEVSFLNDGALLGTALALSDKGEPFAEIRPLVQVINLVDEPDFQELFLAGLELKPMD